MNCKCGAELHASNAKVTGIADGFDLDGLSFDIIVTCDECGTQSNGFLPQSELIELD